MLQPLPLAFLILFSSVMFSFLFVSNANSNIYVQCSQLNFTSMSPYESNVNSLLTSFDDSASICNFNKFETSPQSNSVYGLYQCRGDLITPDCKDCVASAISQLKTTCPVSTGGEIQLEGCFVKYDDTSFFGTQDKMEVCKRCGPPFGYNSDVLNQIDGALANLVGGNGEYFREVHFGSIQGVAQCVQDLSLSDCQDCLVEARGRLRSECETSTWGDMYLGKCYIRYADQGNGNITNSSSTKSNGGGSIVKWIGYILAAILGISLTLTVTFKCKHFCNSYVFGGGLKGDLKDVKGDLKDVKQASDGTEKKVKEMTVKVKEMKDKVEEVADLMQPKCVYPPPCPYPPPPCPYPPPPCPYSNPNVCYYL